ncbi:MAG: acetyl-CoA carboxylase biotin carboxyl carrier protein [Candidatus Sumerlaeaceae bacterium]|nr:acetyl-CoA carboxylase biotin carboxyl carrier protein [Candidatus Sumerlaeaceae bacterium]
MAGTAPKKSSAKTTEAAAGAEDAPLTLSVDDIQKLFELMKANDISELDLEHGGTRVRIVSKQPVAAVPVAVPVAQAAAPVAAAPALVPPVPLPTPAAEAPAAAPPAEPSAPANTKPINSPMVGTFYRAPAPDADPFVRVGDHVKEDTVLCIIEAMKMFNEIKAEMRGRIYKILVENGQPVEYGQPLFLVEPE